MVAVNERSMLVVIVSLLLIPLYLDGYIQTVRHKTSGRFVLRFAAVLIEL